MFILVVFLYLMLSVVFYAILRSEGPIGIGQAIPAILFGGAVIIFIIVFCLPIGAIQYGVDWLRRNA